MEMIRDMLRIFATGGRPAVPKRKPRRKRKVAPKPSKDGGKESEKGKEAEGNNKVAPTAIPTEPERTGPVRKTAEKAATKKEEGEKEGEEEKEESTAASAGTKEEGHSDVKQGDQSNAPSASPFSSSSPRQQNSNDPPLRRHCRIIVSHASGIFPYALPGANAAAKFQMQAASSNDVKDSDENAAETDTSVVVKDGSTTEPKIPVDPSPLVVGPLPQEIQTHLLPHLVMEPPPGIAKKEHEVVYTGTGHGFRAH